MKTLSYTVYQDKIVCVINENNKTKAINIVRDDSSLLKIPECYLDWDGTVVDAVRSLLFKLRIKTDVCMIETIDASPDCSVLWKQRNLVHINSRYKFMCVAETLTDKYHKWELFSKVFEHLGYTVHMEYGICP